LRNDMVVSRGKGAAFYAIAFEIALNVALPAVHQLTHVHVGKGLGIANGCTVNYTQLSKAGP
jgi:hypothetical protein